MRAAAQSVTIAAYAPMLWLLNVTTNGDRSVPKLPAFMTKSLPQSLVTYRSTSDSRRRRYRISGRTLNVRRIVSTTSQLLSVIDQPNAFFSNQYSPAAKVGSRGGLLE